MSASKVVINGDGSIGASASPKEVCLWDIEAKNSIKSIELPKPKFFSKRPKVGSIRFGADHLYIGCNDGAFWVADLSGTMLEKLFVASHQDWIQAFDVHEKDSLAALFIIGGHLELWDLSTNKLVGAVETGADHKVTDVRINPDASSIVTAGKDGSVRVWSIQGKRDLAWSIHFKN
jgi:WD40 repeat protein